MNSIRNQWWPQVLLIGLVSLGGLAAMGQDKSKSPKKTGKGSKSKPIANTKSLDQRADSMTTTFVRDANALADDYLEAGHPEKAIAVLQAVLNLNPNENTIRQKVNQISEQMLSANEYTVDVNANSGWEKSGMLVADGKAFRVVVEGTYRLDLSGTVGPAGWSDKDPVKDFVAGFPCGALMGVIVNRENKSGKPFLIGAANDITPRESGMLLMRVNLPNGHKSNGKLKVTLSGHVAPN